ncbi:MAG: PQQ-binding-like beta-propeller repeat protein [Spirochaetes bacterium]|nr:PQQ-binding-like beta-propeller repeat protein [Spirochaetota bacterium]
MKKCRIGRHDLLLFTFNMINDEKKEVIREHLKECKQCRKEQESYIRLRSTLPAAYPTVPDAMIPNDIQKILKKVKIPSTRKIDSILPEFPLEPVKQLLLRFRSNLAYQIVLLLIILAVPAVLLFSPPASRIYFVDASGDIKVNNSVLFKDYKFKLKKGVEISLKKGDCSLQVDEEQIYVLSPDTTVIIDKKEDIQIQLKKGGFYGYVNREKTRQNLAILVNDLKFVVTGTRFYINYEKDHMVELSVLSGEIKTSINGKEMAIKGGTKFVKRMNTVSLVSLEGREKEEYDKYSRHTLVKEINKADLVSITSHPENAKVYRNGKLIGATPLSFLRQESIDPVILTLHQKGFFPYEVALKPDKDFISHVELFKPRGVKFSWKFQHINKVLSSPLWFKNNIIIGDIRGWINNIDIKQRKFLWRFKTGGRIALSPRLYDDKVYVFSNDKHLYVFDLKTGKLLWKKYAGILIGAEPVFYNGHIYFGNISGDLYGIDSSKGKIDLQLKFKSGFYSPCTIKDDLLYIGDSEGTFYAINIKNKKVLFRYRTSSRIVASTPLIIDDILYFGSNNGYLYALKKRTGALVWKHNTLSMIFSSPVKIGQLVVISTSRGWIYALDNKTGKLNWKLNTGSINLSAPLVYKNRYILAGDKNNNIFILTRYGILAEKLKITFKEFILNENDLLCWNKKGMFSYSLGLQE